MGNCFERSNLIVKPWDGMMMKSREDEDESRERFDATSNPVKIKVRMTKTQLEELKAQADTSEGSYELGRLIFTECLEGRLSPHVVVGQPQPHVSENSISRRLSTIDE